MAIYKTRWFARWARRHGVSDAALRKAVDEMIAGLYDADLGCGLNKKRIARSGQGKRGGFRTLVATDRGDRWFFLYGFSKNERDDIDERETEALKRLATHLLSLNPHETGRAKRAGELLEIG